MWLFEGHSYCMISVRIQLLCNMPKWFMMQRRKRGFDKLLLLKNIWSRSFNCRWTSAFSSRLIYSTSKQAKWQPICILITVLCLQSTDNELLHIVGSDIFAARNLFSLGVFPKPMEMVSGQLVQFKQELHKQSACWLYDPCVKNLISVSTNWWLLDGNHIDQFFHDWWRWISAVEMLSSDKLLKKWSCRRDWFNSEVLFLHGCSEAWMWTRKKQQKSIIKCDTLHYTNCKNRFEWISRADMWNWICNLCKRSFLEDLH